MFWHKLALSLYQRNTKAVIMKNTEYDYDILGSIVSSEDSLAALLEIIDDMDLEITGVRRS